MYHPVSTYRIQLHEKFNFQSLREQLEYLHQLGISTVYASPITGASRGSMHGYDVTDPSVLNPEIGTEEELSQISLLLQQQKMGWLQDIVPNHMAMSTENGRFRDVLERGPASPYYDYFDINWKHPDHPGKVMLPVLEEPDPAPGSFRIIKDDKGFQLKYKELLLPLSTPALQVLQQYLADETGKDAEAQLATVNADEVLMKELLIGLYYLPCYHRETASRINYRRFFTVNSLICLQMEKEAVFKDYHGKIKELCDKQLIQGLRIDHIDGLADPEIYLKRLRENFGDDCYTVAEKILGTEEQLPASWALQGTTGYDFTAMVNRLFTVPEGFDKIVDWYREHIPGTRKYTMETLANRMKILKEYMAGEWENLYRMAKEANIFPEEGKWKEALAALITCMPVYRLYPQTLPLNETAMQTIRETISTAIAFYPACTQELLYLLRLLQNGEPLPEQQLLAFLQRMMQFTGPLMAKGVEDTSFYTWNAFIGRNEVGDAPGNVSKEPVNDFHAAIQQRFANWPMTMNATATHDTKRGEDARIRLLTMAEDPVRWLRLAEKWFSLNRQLLTQVKGKPAPSRNEEFFIYQSIVGGFPVDGNISEEWTERLQQYIAKAIKEAKVNTSWDEAQTGYEEACRAFIEGLFKQSPEFVKQLKEYVNLLDKRARVYSLSQLLLKLTVPGVPDIYQGCELHDYSFVDPDNRRPVDYERRKELLARLQEAGAGQPLAELLREQYNWGIDKLFVCSKTLALRNWFPGLFQKGDYLPLHHPGVKGRISFARRENGKWLIVSVPLPGWKEEQHPVLLNLPSGAPEYWTNVLTGEYMEVKDDLLEVRAGENLLPLILLMNA